MVLFLEVFVLYFYGLVSIFRLEDRLNESKVSRHDATMSQNRPRKYFWFLVGVRFLKIISFFCFRLHRFSPATSHSSAVRTLNRPPPPSWTLASVVVQPP